VPCASQVAPIWPSPRAVPFHDGFVFGRHFAWKTFCVAARILRRSEVWCLIEVLLRLRSTSESVQCEVAARWVSLDFVWRI
jgi:hypothetical protein